MTYNVRQPRRRRRAVTADTLATEVADRSNTLPLCPTCEYRMVALDRCRDVCSRCGVVEHDEGRIVRHLLATFGGRIIVELRTDVS